jgi:hypothetical protein
MVAGPSRSKKRKEKRKISETISLNTVEERERERGVVVQTEGKPKPEARLTAFTPSRNCGSDWRNWRRKKNWYKEKTEM